MQNSQELSLARGQTATLCGHFDYKVLKNGTENRGKKKKYTKF